MLNQQIIKYIDITIDEKIDIKLLGFSKSLKQLSENNLLNSEDVISKINALSDNIKLLENTNKHNKQNNNIDLNKRLFKLELVKDETKSIRSLLDELNIKINKQSSENSNKEIELLYKEIELLYKEIDGIDLTLLKKEIELNKIKNKKLEDIIIKTNNNFYDFKNNSNAKFEELYKKINNLSSEIEELKIGILNSYPNQ